VDTEAAAARWRETWLRGWPAKDVESISGLYAPGAPFRSHPFREPHDARRYVEWAFSEQDEALCWFRPPLVSGDHAVVEYWAVVSFRGRDTTIAGVSIVRFDGTGLVAQQNDYWSEQDGRREPPAGWEG
jgi:SnoaL-like domain